MKTYGNFNFWRWGLLCLSAFLTFGCLTLRATITSGQIRLKVRNYGTTPMPFKYQAGYMDGESLFVVLEISGTAAARTSGEYSLSQYDSEVPEGFYLDAENLFQTFQPGEASGASYIATGPAAETLVYGPAVLSETGFTEEGKKVIQVVLTTQRPSNVDERKTVWETSDSSLTADLFREGIDKVITFQATSASAGTNVSISNAGRNMTGNNSDDVAAIQNGLKNGTAGAQYTDVVSNGLGGGSGFLDFMISKAEEKSAAELAPIESAIPGGVPGSLGYDVTGGSAPSIFDISFGPKLGGVTINMNPFTEARLGGVASAFRQALAWLTLMLLGIWVWRELDRNTKQIGCAPQAKGNTYAGTGGQLTSTLAAVLISAVVVVFFTALVSWAFGDITFSSIRASMTTNPMSGFSEGAMYCLDKLFPIATMISALVARLAWHMYSVPLFVGAQAIVRFINP